LPTRPPLIGLPGRRTHGAKIAGYPEALHETRLDLYFADYAAAIREAGGLPVHLPLDGDVDHYAEVLDALVLPGGADIDPTRYGHEPHPDAYEPEPERDEFELRLLELAIDRELPVLGICRGLQVVNVGSGGTLHQHVPHHNRLDVAPHTEVHDVEFVDGSRLRAIYGERLSVNSLHHQVVAELGSALAVTATADDGTIEGIEHESLPIVAVQWHPEMMTSRPWDPLFGWIVEAARCFRSADAAAPGR
jgi:putative glutamine amidotransferase